MTKRPLCLGAAGVLSGILAAAYGWSVFARALLACGVLACGILGGIFADGYRPGDGISTAERKRTAFGAGVFLLMFALGSGRYLEAEESRQAYLGELQDGMYVTVQGQLAGKQIQKNRYVYELTSCMFRTDSSNFLQTEPVSCGGVLIYSDSDDCSIGDILIYHGEITLWKRASNEGAFDAKAYYFARGFDFAMEGPALDRKVCAKRQTAEALWQLGQRIKEVYLKTMGERDAGILATMVVGDREFLDAETKRLYQIGGLSHILAISGLHISVIGMALYRMLKKAGLPFGMAALAAAGVMYGYGGMAGWGVSVRRAVLMFLPFLGAMIHFVRSHLPQWRFSGKIPACSGTPDSAFPLLQSLASCGSDRAFLMRKKGWERCAEKYLRHRRSGLRHCRLWHGIFMRFRSMRFSSTCSC